MPFDVSGNFSRVYDFETDRINGIKIMSARVDGEFDGVAVGLSETVLRDGRAAMTGNLRLGNNSITGLGDGSLANPAIAFNSETNTGIYRPSAGKLAVDVQGTKRLEVNTTGIEITGNITVSGSVVLPNLNVTGAADFDSGLSTDGDITFAHATNRNVLFGAAGVDGRITMVAAGADYRASDHEFKSVNGLSTFGKFSSTGLTDIVGVINSNHNNQGVPCVDITNVGANLLSGMQLTYQSGGNFVVGGLQSNHVQVSSGNRSMVFSANAEAFDAAASWAFEFINNAQAVLTRGGMLIKNNKAGSTADYLQCQDSASAVKLKIDTSGRLECLARGSDQKRGI
jgi:hypothetical protein